MLHYLQKTQMCIECGRLFISTPDDRREEFNYKKHCEFSRHVKSIMESNSVGSAVNAFFETVGEAGQFDMMEFLECLSRYDCEDRKMLSDVCKKIQEKIDKIIEME